MLNVPPDLHGASSDTLIPERGDRERINQRERAPVCVRVRPAVSLDLCKSDFLQVKTECRRLICLIPSSFILSFRPRPSFLLCSCFLHIFLLLLCVQPFHLHHWFLPSSFFDPFLLDSFLPFFGCHGSHGIPACSAGGSDCSADERLLMLSAARQNVLPQSRGDR